MNAARRKEIERAIDLLYQAKEIIENVRDDEQDAYDNMPESLQYSERGERMSENVDALDNAADYDIEDIITNLNEIIEQ
ncbi:MAG: hypothetical protein IKP11_04575 [Paludibacteraceae bacterium]|jgi:hypothetical protein|nr:hypothetical protein [Paludibacteraceae bacterium]